MTNHSTDRALLSRLKSGDQAAFKQIFTRWREPLLQFIYNIIGSRQDAEDICQEAFTTLWLKHDIIDPEKKINTFLFLIAKQITWKYIRKNQHEDDIHDLPEADHDPDLSPEEILQSKELALLVEYATGKLPPRTREIFNLHYIKELSYEQIAEQLNTNTANIKAQIYQARTKIRDIIAAATLLLIM